jgi:hypothetical protein
MHVIGHQVPFLDAALLLLRQRSEDRSEMLPQLPKERLPTTLPVRSIMGPLLRQFRRMMGPPAREA